MKMRHLNAFITMAALALLLAAGSVMAQTADEIMKKSHLAYYYAGDDGQAEVTMRLQKGDRERIREFTMLRIDLEEGGNQKYYTYFKKPSDVSRMTFMVHKSNGSNDLRWIYVPAVDLIKPISADDKNSSFVGSDFSYEDVSGRHWTEDNHTLINPDGDLDGTAVYIIESVPKEAYDGFARKVSYIDKETFLPRKEEYYDDRNELIRVFSAEKIETIDGIETVTVRSMENVKKGSRTVVEFSAIDYNVGLTEDIFTERYLKNPPRKYIR
jgi:outer membrane lipoprotein-sorting protein